MAASSSFPARPIVWIVAVLGVAFLGIQFIRPELTNPPVTADLQAPPEVQEILRASCYNCHSNETRLPWFDRIVPAYWIAARDVREGRKHLNFSEIGKLPAAQQRATLFESVSQIELGAMPLPAYKRVHPASVVTLEQLAVLKKYLSPANPNQPASAAEISAADAQYDEWIHAGSAPPEAALAPNGISFLPDYKNWRAISSTERFDNHQQCARSLEMMSPSKPSQRITINPVAGRHGLRQSSVVSTGRRQRFGPARGILSSRVYDPATANKYSTTLGWGWARWRGADLKPYGKDAAFHATGM